jgi:hypothetical protein
LARDDARADDPNMRGAAVRRKRAARTTRSNLGTSLRVEAGRAMSRRVALDDFNSIASNGATVSTNGGKKLRRPKLINPADLEMRDPKWLVRPMIPEGALMLVQGHGGTNKGTWAFSQAAAVTRGEVEDGQPAFVLISATEDDYETIVKPRLVAANANLDLVRFVGELSLPEDGQWLSETIDALAARLVVIDPFLSHLQRGIDSYRDHDVKLALTPLMRITQDERCTIMGVHHYTKSTALGAYLSGQASGAFGNTARVVLGMAVGDEEDVRVIEVVKSNIGQTGFRRQLRMKLVTVQGLKEPVPILVDEGHSERTVDELLASGRSRAIVPPGKLKDLVLRELDSGEKSREHLNKAAQDELGASADMLYKNGLAPLKSAGHVRVYKDGATGGWYWSKTGTVLKAA